MNSLRLMALCWFLFGIGSLQAAPPRKGIVYRPTPEGGRACYIDGVFAYEMPPVPKGMYGTTFGVSKTGVLTNGPREQTDWTEYLRSKGFRFERGATATYFAAQDHLVIVNTREQLAALMKWAGVAEDSK